MIISDSARRYILAFFSLIVVVGLILSSMMGSKQNKEFQSNYELFSHMNQQFQEGNYTEALKYGELLMMNHKSSETVNYLTAVSAVNAGEIDKALLHMQRALDINPYYVENPMFMLQYAEMLIQAEQKDAAIKVLERCEVLPIPEVYPEYKDHVTHLQEQLAIQM